MSNSNDLERQACSKFNAALAADAAFPLDALAAIHKCSDAETRAVFQDLKGQQAVNITGV